MKLILIGMMGSGKSTIGKVLASAIDANFLDMDAMIEDREGTSISKIFEDKGESYFRALEHLMAKELEKKENVVIATGGGVVINESTMEALSANGTVIYLHIPVLDIVKRLEGDTQRPLLQNTSLKDKLEQVYSDRKSLYKKYADVILTVQDKSVETIVTDLIRKCKIQ
jgi:shikimate kinase